MKREGGVDTECAEGSRGGEWSFEGVIGHDRRDVFLRRTGPGPGASMRERSAMSQGLRRTGGASREDIQGRLSNAGRRLRRDAAFERVREDTGVHTWGAGQRAVGGDGGRDSRAGGRGGRGS